MPTSWSRTRQPTTCSWSRATSRTWRRRSKRPRPSLFPPPDQRVEKGHGRLERRVVQTSTAGIEDLHFPFVEQVFRIERESTVLSTGEVSREVVYGITSLPPEAAGAARVGSLARGHWEIENSLHWVRDVTFDEDRSQVRTGNGPHALA